MIFFVIFYSASLSRVSWGEKTALQTTYNSGSVYIALISKPVFFWRRSESQKVRTQDSYVQIQMGGGGYHNLEALF